MVYATVMDTTTCIPPQLTCLDATTGSVTSIVHHDGDMTAEMLIDSAVAAIHSNEPPLVNLPRHKWILLLKITNNTVVSNKGKSTKKIVIGTCIGIGCIVTLLLLLLFIVGLVYRIYKRYVPYIDIVSVLLE